MATRLGSIQIIRRVTLGVTLVGLTVMAILHQRLQGIPPIDALDPFGGLETLMKYVAGGEFIKRIEPGTLVLFGGTVALAIVLSRFFCGWFCAFGALQGAFGWLGKKLFRRRFTVPPKADAVLRWMKYPILAAIVYFTWKAGDLVIRPYDPLAAYGHLSAGLEAVWSGFAVGLVMLIIILVLSMFYERAFCKYICPLGAALAILGRIPVLRIQRVVPTCISCKKCDRVCSMNIDVSQAGTIGSPECIACMECVTACPTNKNSLITTLGGKTAKVGFIVTLGFGIYLGAAAIGQATGMLSFSAPSLEEQAATGILKVEGIKGSSTYEAVAESFGIELGRLYREVGVDPKKVPPSSMLRDTGRLAGIAGFEADAVRVAVAKILGLPYSGEKGNLAPARIEAEKPEPAAIVKPIQPIQSALVVPADFALEGTMTISDIASALSSSEAAVKAKLRLPSDIAVDKPLRDMRDQYGYSMPELKGRIKE